MSKITKAAVIGAGVIGAGWAARFAWHGIDVSVFDPHPESERRCRDVLENAERALTRLHGETARRGTVTFAASLADAMAGADYIQESAPEDLARKTALLSEIDKLAQPDALIGSSTSGLLPTKLQSAMAHPERFLVAHPFNPVYLLPLVEVCGGEQTSPEAIERARAFFADIGMKPLHVRTEIDGFIADRLLEALWREALWLVNDDVATVEEVDDAIRYGAGLRWALMGSFLTYRIAGGEDGMRHFMAQFGPALQWPWSKLTDVPELTDDLLDKIAAQSDAQAAGRDTRALERERDDGLVAILRVLGNLDTPEDRETAAPLPERTGLDALIPDFAPYPITHAITDVRQSGATTHVTWSDGLISQFYALWLRDNCPCAECVNQLTREQVFDISSIPADTVPASASVDADGALTVTWPDGHQSRYHPGWLRAHCPSSGGNREPGPKTWGNNFEVPTFNGRDVLASDDALLEWLDALDRYGLTILKDCPTELGGVERFADRVQFLRETNFGRVFDVRSKPDPDSNAYTALELPLHTDLPTRELQPGLQFLLCRLNDAEGGDSVMGDAFRIAETLRAEAPEHFEALATIPMDFRNRARNTDYRLKTPMLGLDHDGNVNEIRLANFLRGPFSAAPEDMPRLYAAYRHFIAMTKEDRFRVRYRLGPGDMSAFNNRRVMHARTAFDPSTGARHLQGCYVDTDEFKSRLRVLRREQTAKAAAIR